VSDPLPSDRPVAQLWLRKEIMRHSNHFNNSTVVINKVYFHTMIADFYPMIADFYRNCDIAMQYCCLSNF
jgi:hypothetical protein